MGAPHLLQKRVPEEMDVPQELQNAINHLAMKYIPTREYNADGDCEA